jgi:hypothetical protein
MRPWIERPREVAHLLNPAFCSVVISSACVGYDEIVDSGLMFPLAFMVLPIVLHKPTRTALPHSIRTSLPSWIQENSFARVQFYERLISLKPYTSEAIYYTLRYNLVELQAGGTLRAVNGGFFSKAISNLEEEARECVLKARFLGKWFASVGSVETTMSLWGVRP